MKWVIFIGEGRSGSSILSSILDAHPNCRISNELKLIRPLLKGENVIDRVLNSGLGKERPFIPGMFEHQEPLLVIGDKCGWELNGIYKKVDTEVLEKLKKKLDIKIIHTFRNPYDNIGSWVNSNKFKRQYPDLKERIDESITRYRKFYKIAFKIIENEDYLTINNSSLINQCENNLVKLCDYLELPFNEQWRDNVIKFVYNKPNSHIVNYSDMQKEAIENIIVKYNLNV